MRESRKQRGLNTYKTSRKDNFIETLFTITETTRGKRNNTVRSDLNKIFVVGVVVVVVVVGGSRQNLFRVTPLSDMNSAFLNWTLTVIPFGTQNSSSTRLGIAY